MPSVHISRARRANAGPLSVKMLDLWNSTRSPSTTLKPRGRLVTAYETNTTPHSHVCKGRGTDGFLRRSSPGAVVGFAVPWMRASLARNRRSTDCAARLEAQGDAPLTGIRLHRLSLVTGQCRRVTGEIRRLAEGSATAFARNQIGTLARLLLESLSIRRIMVLNNGATRPWLRAARRSTTSSAAGVSIGVLVSLQADRISP